LKSTEAEAFSFDKIEVHPEMFKSRAVFGINADPILADLEDIQIGDDM